MGSTGTALVDGALAGYGIAIPVGAVAILIVNTAIAYGFPAGFMAGAGAATADFAYAFLAVVAGTVIATWLEPYQTPLRAVSGVVLIGLALIGLLALRRPSQAESARPGASSPLRVYLRFVGITLVNPLTVIYFTAFILGRGSASLGSSMAANTAFVLGAGLASLSWQTLLAVLGGLAGSRLTPRFRILTTSAGNLLVLALGISAITGGLG